MDTPTRKRPPSGSPEALNQKIPLKVSRLFVEAVDAYRRRVVVEGGPLLTRADAIRGLVEAGASAEFAELRRTGLLATH